MLITKTRRQDTMVAKKASSKKTTKKKSAEEDPLDADLVEKIRRTLETRNEKKQK